MDLSPTLLHLLSQMTPQQIATVLQNAQNELASNTVSKITKSNKKVKKSNAVTTLNKATRPLNSWIAYRSMKSHFPQSSYADTKAGYYSSIFSALQQKEISGLMKHMWEADPFKAKWAILAKAYSMIRDEQGKSNTPLDDFLALSVPKINIIKPTHYLDAIGWKIAHGEEGQISMQLSGKVIDLDFLTTDVSVNDLIRNAYRVGFFTGNLFNVLLSDNEPCMAMATAGQIPSKHIPKEGDRTIVVMSHTSSVLDATTPNMGNLTAMEMESANNEDPNRVANGNRGQVPVANQTTEEGSQSTDSQNTAANQQNVSIGMYVIHDTHALTRQSQSADTRASHSIRALPTGDRNTHEQGSATSNPATSDELSRAGNHLHGEDDLYATFDPDAPTYIWDPYVGDQFDAFDMSGGWTPPAQD